MVVALNTLGRFELFPSPGTVVVFRFDLLDSGLSIPNEFGGLMHSKVKSEIRFRKYHDTAGKKVKSFTSEYFRVQI